MIHLWWLFSLYLTFCVLGTMTDHLGVVLTSTPCGCPLHLTFHVLGTMTQPSWEWCVLPQPTWWLFSHYFILCFKHNDSIILGGACTPIIHLGQSLSCCDLPLVICLSQRWHVPLITLPHPEHDDLTILGVMLTP